MPRHGGHNLFCYQMPDRNGGQDVVDGHHDGAQCSLLMVYIESKQQFIARRSRPAGDYCRVSRDAVQYASRETFTTRVICEDSNCQCNATIDHKVPLQFS